MLEIEDITVIAKLLGFALEFVEQAFNRGCASCAGDSCHKNVIPEMIHREADAQRTKSPLLADNLPAWLDFSARPDLQCFRVAAPAKFFERKRIV